MSSESSYADQRLRGCGRPWLRRPDEPARATHLHDEHRHRPDGGSLFRRRHNDPKLLSLLVAIALEGEDAGDAPWAAANTIADFPAEMLLRHKPNLEKLAAEQWTYLHVPGRQALEKLASTGGAR